MTAVDEGGPARELVVDIAPAPGDSSDSGGSAMAPFALTALSAGVLAKFVSLTAALVPLGVAVVVLLVRRRANAGRFVLRVDDGVLDVARERGSHVPTRIALADLLDVTLERKAHAASGRGGNATERVRLAFERRAPEGPVFVPDERVTPIEAQEWYGKVRVFLRRHGWVPADERPLP